MDKKQRTSKKSVLIAVRIDPDVFAQITALAASKGITTSTAFRRALARYLNSTDTKGASQ